MKRIMKYFFTFIILLIFFFMGNNHIEAKDLVFYATKMDDDLVFQTYIGSHRSSVDKWNSAYGPNGFEDAFDYTYRRFYYEDNKTFKKENESYRSDSKYKNIYDNSFEKLSAGTIGSNSFIIHNKPFSVYSSGNQYSCFVYDENSQKNAIQTVSVISNNSEVKSIEFDRFTNGHQIIKKDGQNIFVSNNKFFSSHLDILKNSINEYKAEETDRRLLLLYFRTDWLASK